MAGADDFDDSDAPPRKLTAEPRNTEESEFAMCKSVIASVRAALEESEEELRQAKRAFRAKVHSLEQEIRMLEHANQRLRDAHKAKK